LYLQITLPHPKPKDFRLFHEIIICLWQSHLSGATFFLSARLIFGEAAQIPITLLTSFAILWQLSATQSRSFAPQSVSQNNHTHMFKLLLLVIFPTWFFLETSYVNDGYTSSFPYQLENPDATLIMPVGLKEVSGLGPMGQMFAAINDETGIVFLLDKTTGEVKKQVTFKESGDFEGVEIVDNDAWAIKSNGTLYRIKNFMEPNPEVQAYKSFLDKENDVEGLAFDAKNNRLLLGCKGRGLDREGMPLNKAIYAFDLTTMSVADTPAFLLTLPNLEGFLANSDEPGAKKKMEHVYTSEDSQLKFSPSGIAVHPISGDIYITSARGNTLLVLYSDGKIRNLERLKKSVHTQPEGLCFDADGTMYIANEGLNESPGKVYVFHPK
jgi:uncharacterized protein YjiK